MQPSQCPITCGSGNGRKCRARSVEQTPQTRVRSARYALFYERHVRGSPLRLADETDAEGSEAAVGSPVDEARHEAAFWRVYEELPDPGTGPDPEGSDAEVGSPVDGAAFWRVYTAGGWTHSS